MANITFKNVTKKIKKTTVINNLNFSLNSGQVTGFKGINGSGKTMIMRLISGLIYPSSGEVAINSRVLGKEITFPESLGILIENPAFLDTYSGYQNLRMLASINRTTSNEQILKALDTVGLAENMHKKYKKYSLGMKQRLGIAAAIMEAPDIIILDEPTNSLDNSGVEMVQKVIQQEKSRGATIILSCHDGGLLEAMSDRIFLVESGSITHTYTPSDSLSGRGGLK